MTDKPRMCSKCGEQPAGPGGILCPACVTAIEAARGGYRHSASDGSDQYAEPGKIPPSND